MIINQNELVRDVKQINICFFSKYNFLLKCIACVLFGLLVYFLLNSLLVVSLSPFATLFSSFISGGLGLLLSALCLRNIDGFKIFILSIFISYILRVFIGVGLYINTFDYNYFYNEGYYINNGLKGNEYLLTYENAAIAAKSLLNDPWINPNDIYLNKGIDNKNAYIHTYMGIFYALSGSDNAMDLAPFNAFHHLIAAILVVCLALSCGYQVKHSVYSGVMMAWLPWLFPASVMVRDSVGFAAVVLSMVILALSRSLGLIGYIFLTPVAALIAWSDRAIYFGITYVVSLYSYIIDIKNSKKSFNHKFIHFFYLIFLLVPFIYFFYEYISSMTIDFRHENIATSNNLIHRMTTLPLLLLRALSGPFPWFVGYGNFFTYFHLFNYMYHVVQFSFFMIVVFNFKSFFKEIDLLIIASTLYWCVGFMAGGVHTDYLAVAFPFITPFVISVQKNIFIYIIVSFICFLIANLLWIFFGFAGSGSVMGITGY